MEEADEAGELRRLLRDLELPGIIERARAIHAGAGHEAACAPA